MKLRWPFPLKLSGARPAPPSRPTPLRVSALARPSRPVHRLRGARAADPMEDYEEEHPTTKLSVAFFVMVALHVVAVGGIYAFNSIKANRAPEIEPVAASLEKPTLPKAAAPATAPAIVSNKPVPLPDKPAPHEAPKAPAAPAGSHSYTVRMGDTLPKVATQQNVTLADLAAANNLALSASLHPGQTLTVPAAKPAASIEQQRAAFLATRNPDGTAKKLGRAAPKSYTVAKGDTLMSIGRKFGVTYDDLVKLNKIEDPKKLQIGTTLKMPQPKSTAAN